MRPNRLITAATLAAFVALGVAAAAPMDTGASAPAQPTAGEPVRRELFAALAELAGVTPRDLRAAVEQHGGLLRALETLGVTQRQLFDVLLQQSRRRLQPAIDEGRLSPEQAEQLAQRLARRYLRQLGGTAPRDG